MKVSCIFRVTSILIAVQTLICLCPLYSWCQQSKDMLVPCSSIHLNGMIGDRLNASYENRILAQDADRLIAVFKVENRNETKMWQSEFWGKWITSAILAYRYKPEQRLKKVLDYAVNGLMATQTPDGYIGNYDKNHLLEQWDVWGRKYCMLGLLDYYDLTGEKKSLKAAARLADNLMDDLAKSDGILVTKGNYRGMAASSVLEPIALLYSRTLEKKYLVFAEEIVKQWESSDGPQLISKSGVNVADRFPKPKDWYSWEQGQKAYEMMSCYEGLLELYRLTGKEAYKKAVENTWQNIKDTEINVAGSGASVEMWFGGKTLQGYPVDHYQETCVTVTWIKLSTQLLRLTGEAKYADAIEKAYYNALLGAMSSDGFHWAKYTPLTGQRLPGSEQCSMGLNCCEASGPRGLFLFPFYAVTKTKEGLQVNYYVDGEYEINTPGKQRLLVKQHTLYPAEGKVMLQVYPRKAEELIVSVRIPEWSLQTQVKVNGEDVPNVKTGSYLSIKRGWKSGDQIELDFDMRGRVEKTGNNPSYSAILRGPVLLSRDARFNDVVPVGVIAKPMADDDGHVELSRVKSNVEGVWMQYTTLVMPESYTEGGAKLIPVNLCDYASAGNDKNKPFFQTWLPQLIDPRNK